MPAPPALLHRGYAVLQIGRILGMMSYLCHVSAEGGVGECPVLLPRIVG